MTPRAATDDPQSRAPGIVGHRIGRSQNGSHDGEQRGHRRFRSRARWSAGKKLDVVLRLLRGEKPDEVSREVGIEAHRIAAWRDEFLDAGKQGLKGKQATTDDDRRLRDAERKIGELTLENEI